MKLRFWWVVNKDEDDNYIQRSIVIEGIDVETCEQKFREIVKDKRIFPYVEDLDDN